MAARLIVNADDFGLTRGINRAVAQLYQVGALTSATLMASGPAFDDAVSIARSHPALGIGCHILLVDGVPVSDPATLPTLCPNRRTLRPSLRDFIRSLLLGRIDPAEIHREALAQIEKIEAAGIPLTHLDTHKHTHLFPAVAAPLASILRPDRRLALRNPFEPAFSRRSAVTPLLRRIQLAALHGLRPRWQRVTRSVPTTDGTLGISATGSLNPTTLRATLDALPASGTFELICHPGHNDADLDAISTRLRPHREVEYLALLHAIPSLSLQPDPPRLIHFGSLCPQPELRPQALSPQHTGYPNH